MLLFAIIVIIYAFSEIIGGSGPISALIFGLILSNGKKIGDLINKVIRIEPTIEVPADMKKFHTEISFFVKSFFFVFLGMLISPRLLPTTFNSLILWLIGLAIVTGLIVVRYVAVKISQIKSNEPTLHTKLMTTILPRGLTAAVLATTPLTYKLAERSDIPRVYLTDFTDVTFIIIITTVLLMAVGVPIINKRMKNESHKNEKDKKELDTKQQTATAENP